MPFDPPPPAPPRPQTRTALAVAMVAILAAALGAFFFVWERYVFYTLAVGVLSAVSTIVGFYFGSSRGSQAKDATIAALSESGAAARKDGVS